MNRRDCIALVGGAAAWPLAARAQQSTTPVIGFLGAVPPSNAPKWVDGFRQGLAETGYDEGRNVAVEYRWSDSDYDRLPALAAAYFLYPPKLSFYIADPTHAAELGFILLLSVTASKAIGVMTDNRRR